MIIKEQSLLASYLKYNEETSYIANGTNLNKFKVKDNLIDLSSLLDNNITKLSDGSLCISAMATFTSIINSPLTPSYLKDAALALASIALRNASTIAGDIALRNEDSYLLPLLLAAEAKIEVFCEKLEELTIDEYLKLNNKRLIITKVIINPELNIKTKRISKTSSCKATINVARNLDSRYCFSISSSGIFTSLSSLTKDSIVSDIYGDKEYKYYLAKELSTLGADK